MAIINAASLTALRTMVRKEFEKGREQATPNYKPFTMEVPSTSASNTYGWLGSMANVREWIGDRVINDLKEHGYSINNRSFELSVGVKGTDIEDDNLGVYAPLFQDMGLQMENHPGELVYEVVQAGFTTVCFDSQYFFDTDHPIYANHDGTGAVTTVSNFTDGVGEAWYLMDCSRPIKPIINQIRKKPQFTAMDNPTDPNVFTKNEFQFGTDRRGNAGYGLWQLAHASKATLDEANFKAARQAMRSLTKDGGKPLGIKPTHIVVGASNIDAAEDLFTKRTLPNGEENTLYKKIEIIEADYLP